jgi:hypothetical protein
MALPGHSRPRPLIQFRNHFSQTVGLLGRVISPSQGRYRHTGQHKHRINAYTPNIHALSGIRIHEPSVRASEDSWCLRPRSYCDRRNDLRFLPKIKKLSNVDPPPPPEITTSIYLFYFLAVKMYSCETWCCVLSDLPLGDDSCNPLAAYSDSEL